MRKSQKHFLRYSIILLLALSLYIVACMHQGFCRFYIKSLFPVFVNVYARFMNIFPFSVGEILLYIGVALVVIGGLTGIIALWKKLRKKSIPVWFISYWICLGYLICGLVLWMICTCFILYRGEGFAKETGLAEITISQDEQVSMLLEYRNDMVETCNELSKKVERDEEGSVILPETAEESCKSAMKHLGEKYPQLTGYYPDVKPLQTSVFFSQQNILGYYFPFSMEANYNKLMYSMNYPATLCHELSHIKGYILEDEANFISYLACVNDEDIYLQYSGYLSVLPYVERDLRKLIKGGVITEDKLLGVDPVVYEDTKFLTQEVREYVERKKWLPTDMVQKASNQFTDTTLKMNGVSEGIVSYSKVVELIIKYEYQK